jgi:hypothetical protein
MKRREKDAGLEKALLHGVSSRMAAPP